MGGPTGSWPRTPPPRRSCCAGRTPTPGSTPWMSTTSRRTAPEPCSATPSRPAPSGRCSPPSGPSGGRCSSARPRATSGTPSPPRGSSASSSSCSRCTTGCSRRACTPPAATRTSPSGTGGWRWCGGCGPGPGTAAGPWPGSPRSGSAAPMPTSWSRSGTAPRTCPVPRRRSPRGAGPRRRTTDRAGDGTYRPGRSPRWFSPGPTTAGSVTARRPSPTTSGPGPASTFPTSRTPWPAAGPTAPAGPWSPAVAGTGSSRGCGRWPRNIRTRAW